MIQPWVKIAKDIAPQIRPDNNCTVLNASMEDGFTGIPADVIKAASMTPRPSTPWITVTLSSVLIPIVCSTPGGKYL
ncbi:hypothetical protein D1872_262070 [compost metagenome]